MPRSAMLPDKRHAEGRETNAHLLAIYGFVEVALLGGELHPDHNLLLVRQVLNILLHAPQQHRPQFSLGSARQNVHVRLALL